MGKKSERKRPRRPQEWDEAFKRPKFEFPPIDFNVYFLDPDPAKVEGALLYDLETIRDRLNEVNKVFKELEQSRQALKALDELGVRMAAIDPSLSGDMRQAISWGQACLQTACAKIDNLFRGVAPDASAGAAQRPGWSEGGKRGAAVRDEGKQERNEKIRKEDAWLQTQRPALNATGRYEHIGKQYSLSRSQISRIVSSKKTDPSLT